MLDDSTLLLRYATARSAAGERRGASRTALREQANVVLEPMADGTWLAKRGPAR